MRAFYFLFEESDIDHPGSQGPVLFMKKTVEGIYQSPIAVHNSCSFSVGLSMQHEDYEGISAG